MGVTKGNTEESMVLNENKSTPRSRKNGYLMYKEGLHLVTFLQHHAWYVEYVLSCIMHTPILPVVSENGTF